MSGFITGLLEAATELCSSNRLHLRLGCMHGRDDDDLDAGSRVDRGYTDLVTRLAELEEDFATITRHGIHPLPRLSSDLGEVGAADLVEFVHVIPEAYDTVSVGPSGKVGREDRDRIAYSNVQPLA